jgi:NADH dehydrogenase
MIRTLRFSADSSRSATVGLLRFSNGKEGHTWLTAPGAGWDTDHVKSVTSNQRPRVVIVGAGFGGLQAARRLRNQPVDVLLLDRHNHHTFIPLLYEVASAGLDPDDIAQPVRAIVRDTKNVRFRLAAVDRVDLDRRIVETDREEIAYDYLVVAAGSATNFFGVDSARTHAAGMHDIRHAMAVRARILSNYERAETTADPAERGRLMTIVVIGGGPTGVELAGSLAELKAHVLSRDHPDLDISRAHVLLLEATDTLLAAFPPRLRRRALEQLQDLGVEVCFGAAVTEVEDRGVRLAAGERIESANVIWVAGARGEDLGAAMSVAVAPGGRVRVAETLQVPGHPEAFVIGDLAFVETPDGRGYPMLAPVAMQQGRLAAENILRLIQGNEPQRFRYKDRGIMATIGRRKAVAHVFHLQLSGVIAWMMWLFVHLIQIVGLRNRALVLLNWAWNYVRYDRAHRIIPEEVWNQAAADSENQTPVSSGGSG